jgi:signal transduction histidine kinase
MCAALSSALFIAVYMASSIMERLRVQRETLERALAETERLESEKSRFMNVVAHDLKSPLASIETMVSSALAVYGDRIPPKVREMMERIPVRTGELLKFIRELLDYSQIRSADLLEVQFEPLDLLPVLREVVDIQGSIARNRNITLSFNAARGVPPVMGNREYLKRVAANLISNAVRYTPENGSVTVTLSPVDKGAVLTVADTGIGIPADDLSRIFTDFFRAGNARKFSPSGTGLGLSIARSIVEMHGGAISVSSTVGAGTTFTVRLPAYGSVAEEHGSVQGNSGIVEG